MLTGHINDVTMAILGTYKLRKAQHFILTLKYDPRVLSKISCQNCYKRIEDMIPTCTGKFGLRCRISSTQIFIIRTSDLQLYYKWFTQQYMNVTTETQCC